MSEGIIDSLLDCSDSILGIRDQIGATLKKVYLVTRIWTGDRVGSGTPEDVEEQMLPSPKVVDMSHNIKLTEGGAVKQGDIFLRGISKNKYTEAQIDGMSEADNVEHFFRVGDHLYVVVGPVVEKHLVWSVQLRRRSDQRRYPA